MTKEDNGTGKYETVDDLYRTLDDVFENYVGEALGNDDRFNWEEPEESSEGETVEEFLERIDEEIGVGITLEECEKLPLRDRILYNSAQLIKRERGDKSAEVFKFELNDK